MAWRGLIKYIMNKQQIIEQISNIIDNSCCRIDADHNCTTNCSKCVAESIYEKLFSENTVMQWTSDKFMSSISNDILVVNTKEYGNIEVVPIERLQEIVQTLNIYK